MAIPPNSLRFGVALALFATLAFFAWKSGRQIYETGPQLAIAETGDAVILRWAHSVDAPMAERFAAAFDAWKGKTGRFIIDLNSPGGSITEGRLVIEAIDRMKETHRVDAYVGDGAYCLSMCVPIYLAGERRTAAASAAFMFHEPSTRDLFTDEKIDRPGFEQRMTSEKFFDRYFASSGMDPAWRERLRAEWRGRDLWFSAGELVEQRAGVVQAVE